MAGKQRRSVCQDSETAGQYLFVFPQISTSHASGYGWEVDRENCKFITVNRQGAFTVPIKDFRDGRTLLPQHQEQHQITFALEETEGDVDELEVSICALSLESGAGEQRPKRTPVKSYRDISNLLYSSPVFRRTVYFSHCTLRKIQELELLYNRYPDDRLVGCVDNEGNTGALAALTLVQQSQEIVVATKSRSLLRMVSDRQSLEQIFKSGFNWANYEHLQAALSDSTSSATCH